MKHNLLSFFKFSIAGSSIAALLFLANIALALPVNVNTADADTIADALNGVGEKTAQKIVAYRDTNGLFKNVEDLLNVNGIGEKKLAKFKEDILLNDSQSKKVAPEKAVKSKVAKSK